MFSFLKAILVAVTVALAHGGSLRASTAAPPKNIVQLAETVPELSTLVKLVVAADLTDTLSGAGPYTVFAPTNDAFEKLGTATLEKLLKPENKPELVKILTYHVASGSVKSTDLTDGEKITTVEGDDVEAHIRGSEVFINDALVEKADNEASNGIVHIVGSVLLPPAPAPTPAPPASKNIVELAESVPELSLLVKLVVAANLTQTLSGTGPFTVFAPTDEAFEKLGRETLEKLLKPENKAELVKILTYHVASGSVKSTDLKNGENIATVEGDDVEVHVIADRIYINRSRVVQADNEASNGIVHIVDEVLIPA
jgi:uncharacterized surface protein with fasciclin (FAS1) repeats